MRSAASGGNFFRDFDWIMAGLVFLICVVGVVQVYSATLNTKFQGVHTDHLMWLAIGAGLFWFASSVDYHFSVWASPVLWLAGLLALLAVLAFTDPINGARRWLPTPFGFSVQVSEFMKVVLILVVAKYCAKLSTKMSGFFDYAVIAVLFFAPFGVVVLQPDLSTALSTVPILAMGLYLTSIPQKHFVIVGLVAVLLVPIGWSMLKPYQKARITGFLDPEESPRSLGYQILQSKIAVGAGGIWGQGFVQGSQTQLRFLPTPHTDFIFAAFAEERGFFGITLLLALYYLLLMRIVQTGQSAADAEGSIIAMCVAALLLFHILVNVGMVANKLPVTGLPLPLMSYGGSNLLTCLVMLGLVNNVRLRRFVN